MPVRLRPRAPQKLVGMKSIAFYIGMRYLRSKQRNGFVSFISVVSMLGIAIGVAVLITVLSVMNGFDFQIRKQFFSLAPQLTVMTPAPIQSQWSQLERRLHTYQQVDGLAPFISSKAMLVSDGQMSGSYIIGINPKLQPAVSEISQKMQQGHLDSLTAGSFHIILGQSLADSLGLDIGSKLLLLLPQATTTPVGIMPRYKRFIVSGIFHAGDGFGFDSSIAYINLSDAARLFKGLGVTNGVFVKLSDYSLAPLFARTLQATLSGGYRVTSWDQTNGAFFKALAMEKTMMFLILILIVAVAVFNLVSGLVMMVQDKRSDIAILRTIGASPAMVMQTFIVQGCFIGCIGTVVGLLLGVILSLNATAIVRFLQNVLHTQFISSSVYFVDYLPSRLQFSDIWHVGVIAFVFSLLASIYPSWQAFRTQPAEALRYE